MMIRKRLSSIDEGCCLSVKEASQPQKEVANGLVELWRDRLHAPLYREPQGAGWRAFAIAPMLAHLPRRNTSARNCKFLVPQLGAGRPALRPPMRTTCPTSARTATSPVWCPNI